MTDESIESEFHNIDDLVEIRRLKQELSLAEEGLANYAQENEKLRKALSQRLQQLEEARRCLEGIASCSTCEVCRGAARSTLHPTGDGT